MKVSSPIGDLPFKPTQLKVKEGAIHMDGTMGAWPAHVQIEMSDIFEIAYLLRYVLLALMTGIVAIISIKSIRK
jgi:hypothetical protein